MDKEVKLCECGCGLPAPIATRTNKRYGSEKGLPQRYCRGHHFRGKPSHLRGTTRSADAIAKQIRSYCKREPIFSPFIEGLIVSFNKKGNRWFCPGSAGKHRRTHAKAVYEHYNGTIPVGHHVHHMNGDPSKLENDHPDNLMIVPDEWNLRYFPVLAKGFQMTESEVTTLYCELRDKTKPSLMFSAICEGLLKRTKT